MSKRNSEGMDLRTRIALAFILVIIIPVALTSVTFFCLVNYKLERFGKLYGIEDPGIESVYNNALVISRKMDEELKSIKEDLTENPDRIESTEYLEEINASLYENGAFLIIRKDGEIYFNGSRDMTNLNLEEALPEDLSHEADKNGYLEVRNQALLKQMNFTFSDGSSGSIFLVSQLNRVTPELRNAVVETVLIILIILSITSLAMAFWIYQSVMRPIVDLKAAAQNIRDGNLDFHTKKSDIQEINDLCEDFEEMRIRLKESAEEKLAFDKQSKELISNISHDLKTPVTAIKGYAEGLLDGVADTPEKQERYIKTIYHKTLEITRLIDELTMYSRIDTNRIPYNFAKVHANEFFNDCREELSMELEQENVSLNYFNYLHGDPLIMADPEQIRRVINNIIGNSIKYMDKPHGIINIRLRDVGDFVQVEIEDNGRGIAQKDLTRIFDRFFRSDTARQSKGGSGIGLSIVRKILEDHEGKVWATSKEGVGTVVYFVLRKIELDEDLKTDTEKKGRQEDTK